jgi:hypothetical protein
MKSVKVPKRASVVAKSSRTSTMTEEKEQNIGKVPATPENDNQLAVQK